MSIMLSLHFIPSLPLQTAAHPFSDLIPQIGLWSLVVLLIILICRIESYKRQQFVLLSRLQQQQDHELEIQEAERKRIAADLHDEIGSNLAAIRINLENLLHSELSDGFKARCLLQLVDQTSQNVRRATHDLVPPQFDTTPFTSILQSYFAGLGSCHQGINFYYYNNAYQACFTTRQELLLYRIVMELTHNVIRHSKAKAATVQILFCPEYLEIMVEDDGIGFSTDQQQQGIGLNSVQSRVKSLGGNIHIDSGKCGTTFIIHIPVISEHACAH